jgi:hypothetical protein
MKPTTAILPICLSAATASSAAPARFARVRVGWCARTISSGAAPFAVATKMSWFREGPMGGAARPPADREARGTLDAEC